MMSSIQENPSRELVKAIETKVDRVQQITATLDPEQERSFDDDDDDTMSYQRYTKYRDEQEAMDRDFIQHSSQ